MKGESISFTDHSTRFVYGNCCISVILSYVLAVSESMNRDKILWQNAKYGAKFNVHWISNIHILIWKKIQRLYLYNYWHNNVRAIHIMYILCLSLFLNIKLEMKRNHLRLKEFYIQAYDIFNFFLVKFLFNVFNHRHLVMCFLVYKAHQHVQKLYFMYINRMWMNIMIQLNRMLRVYVRCKDISSNAADCNRCPTVEFFSISFMWGRSCTIGYLRTNTPRNEMFF